MINSQYSECSDNNISGLQVGEEDEMGGWEDVCVVRGDGGKEMVMCAMW